jgi:signal transduction histidine kinase
VTRYNGADFVTFSKANTPELFSDRMLFMLKNHQGKIFTSDEVGNIFFVMQNKLQFLGRVPLDARPSTFKLIGLAASGKMFRQSAEQSPELFGFNFRNELLIPLDNERILLYHCDSLYDYRAGTREPTLITAVEPGSRVFYLAGQVFIFNRQSGFFRLDAAAHKIPVRLSFGKGEGPIPGAPQQIYWQSNMKDPILIAGSRVWALEYMDQQLIPRLICTAAPTEDLISFVLYAEKKGILILGTNSKGVIMIREDQVRPVRSALPSSDRITSTYSQLALANGTILTSQGDILGGPSPPPSQLPIRTVFNNFILQGRDSLLWYSFGDSICSYSYRTGKTSRIFAGKGSITDGFVISDSNLYVANAIGIGLVRGEKVEYLFHYPQADINSNVPFSMVEMSPGTLAIASCNGLFRFNIRTNRLDTLMVQPGTCIRALWKYKNYLFIGTYGKGIYIYKDGILKAIPSDKSRYLEYAHCFIPDRLGYCWISTNKGLFRARPLDMINAFEHPVKEIYYHYYGRNDGLAITELNGGCTPCALLLNDSTVSFPSMDGLVWVDPSRPLIQLPEGNIYIDAFLADGVKINTTSLLQPQLSSHVRDLEFYLGFPAWVNKENMYIDYKLEPWAKEWQSLDIQHKPTLRFSNLPPGDYTLSLRKLNGFGDRNYAYTESRFRIEAPWYQQPWVWLLGLCVLTGLVAGIVRLRTRQFQVSQNRLQRQIAEKTRELKKKNEELEKTDHIKTRLISIISHDLVTPLKFLHLAGKSLIEKKDELSEELQRETITEIMNTSKELELLSTNILNWIKYRNEDRRLAKESFNVQQLVSQLFGIFNAMAKQKRIRLINKVDEEGNLYQFIEPVKIVLYNLILNGINFTSEGYILVSSVFSQEGVSLIIRDTGVGMTQDQINNIMADHFIISSANVDRRKGNGLGYLIIKDLLKISRGSLSIESEKGNGTQVTVRLPVQ